MIEQIFKLDMFNQKLIISGLVLTELVPFGAEAKYIQYGALTILFLLLIWYGKNSYKADANREKERVLEKKAMAERHAEKEKELRAEIERERVRYDEINKELLVLLKNNK